MFTHAEALHPRRITTRPQAKPPSATAGLNASRQNAVRVVCRHFQGHHGSNLFVVEMLNGSICPERRGSPARRQQMHNAAAACCQPQVDAGDPVGADRCLDKSHLIVTDIPRVGVVKT